MENLQPFALGLGTDRAATGTEQLFRERLTVEPTAAGYIKRVIGYLQQRAAARGVALPSETESLMKSDVLDSFGMLEFVVFIEEELKIQIPDDDLLAGNFDTVAKVRAYIGGRVEG